MNGFYLSPTDSLVIGIVIILIILGYLISLFTRASLFITNRTLSGRKPIYMLAYSQVLLGAMVVLVLWELNAGAPAADLTGIGVTLLSGFPLMHWFFKKSWKETLPLWGVAAGFEVVLFPICLVILLIILLAILGRIYVPVA